MRGGIRAIIGFMFVYGAAGGIETSTTDYELFVNCLVASLGFMVLISGVNAMNRSSE